MLALISILLSLSTLAACVAWSRSADRAYSALLRRVCELERIERERLQIRSILEAMSADATARVASRN